MGLFSKELAIMDSNTVTYMMDEMQAEGRAGGKRPPVGRTSSRACFIATKVIKEA